MLTRKLNLVIASAFALGIVAPVMARAELPHERLHRFLFDDRNDDGEHWKKKKKHKHDRDERRYKHRCYDHDRSGFCDVCDIRLTVVKPAPVRVYPRVRFESYRVHDRYNRPIEFDVQIALRSEGYYRGPIDGDIGPGTRYAIRGYQYDYGLPVTGRIDRYLLGSLGLR